MSKKTMDLKTYLDWKRLLLKEFAEMIEVSPATISNYLNGHRKPTLEIGRRIEKITSGKVTIDDLLLHWQTKKKK